MAWSNSNTEATVDGANLCWEKAASRRLFIEEAENVAIKVCKISDSQPFESRRVMGAVSETGDVSFIDYVTKFALEMNSTKVLIIPQHTSRSPLDVTSDGLSLLLGKIGALPAVTRILDAFVPEDTDFQLGRGGVHFSPTVLSQPPGNGLLEMCCLLKYVQPNERGASVLEDSFAWSIRQMGFYDIHKTLDKSQTTMLIHPSGEVWRRILVQLRDSPASKPWDHWTHMTLLVLKSLPYGWTAYLRTLHRAVSRMQIDAAFDNHGKSLRAINTETLKDSSVYRDRLQQANHALQSNCDTVQAVLVEAQRRQNCLAMTESDSEYEAFEFGLQSIVRELQFTQSQVQRIAQRLDQTAASFQSVATLENSNFMGQVTAKSIVEAQAVRIIALLTFLLLPPTFTAGFLEMGFIDVVSYKDGLFSLTAKPGLLFYLVITVPLMVLTVGGWFFWDSRSRQKAKDSWSSQV